MIYYEYRNGLIRVSPPKLMSKIDAKTPPGFSSVFGYTEETARIITENQSSRDIGNLELYCDELYLDFDSEVGIQPAIDYLNGENIYYSLYTTGNRGKHIHIDIVPVQGYGLPQGFKHFVAMRFPGADTSIYKPTGIIRNVGTWHQKNPGYSKQLLDTKPGRTMLIDMDVTPRIPLSINDRGDPKELLGALLLKRITNGERNNKMYSLAKVAKESQMSKNEVEEILWHYNRSSVVPPLDSREFQNVINSCFGGRG